MFSVWFLFSIFIFRRKAETAARNGSLEMFARCGEMGKGEIANFNATSDLQTTMKASASNTLEGKKMKKFPFLNLIPFFTLHREFCKIGSNVPSCWTFTPTARFETFRDVERRVPRKNQPLYWKFCYYEKNALLSLFLFIVVIGWF